MKGDEGAASFFFVFKKEGIYMCARNRDGEILVDFGCTKRRRRVCDTRGRSAAGDCFGLLGIGSNCRVYRKEQSFPPLPPRSFASFVRFCVIASVVSFAFWFFVVVPLMVGIKIWGGGWGGGCTGTVEHQFQRCRQQKEYNSKATAERAPRVHLPSLFSVLLRALTALTGRGAVCCWIGDLI
jgi:hypothetical protein